MRKTPALLFFATSLLPSAVAQIQTISVDKRFDPTLLSVDGSFAFGLSWGLGAPTRAERWQRTLAPDEVVPPISGVFSSIVPAGLSADGQHAVVSVLSDQWNGSFRWQPGTGLVAMPNFSGPHPAGYDVSRVSAASKNAQVLFGTANWFSGTFQWEALRWVGNAPPTSLCNAYPASCSYTPIAADEDGDAVLVLSPLSSSSNAGLYRWTPSNGFELIEAGVHSYSGYGAISADGQTVAATRANGSAFLWTPSSGIIDIGKPPGFPAAPRLKGSADLGTLLTTDGPPFLWTATGGWVSLRDRMVAQGAISLLHSGAEVNEAMAISGDGNTVSCRIEGYPSDQPFHDGAFIVHMGASGPGTIGSNSCGPSPMNSAGFASSLYATGSPVLANNDAVLHADGLPPNQFGIVINSQGLSFVAQPGGSMGNLCIGGPGQSIGRHNRLQDIRLSGADGTLAYALDWNLLPTATGFVAAALGETWHFQVWHRDQVSGQSTSNFTDAVSILVE